MITKFKAGPFNYDVILDKTHTYSDSCFGKTSDRDQKVYIDPTVSEAMQKETLLHEIFHVAFFVSGLEEMLPDSKNEEKIVRAMSTFIFMMLKDNEHLKQYLFDEKDKEQNGTT